MTSSSGDNRPWSFGFAEIKRHQSSHQVSCNTTTADPVGQHQPAVAQRWAIARRLARDIRQQRRASRHVVERDCSGLSLLNPAAEPDVNGYPDHGDDDGGGERVHGLSPGVRSRSCSRRHRHRHDRARCWDGRWHRHPSSRSARFLTLRRNRLHRSCSSGRHTSKLLLTSLHCVCNCSISAEICRG